MNISNVSLDAIDMKILRELQEDARLSNIVLAGKVGLSPSPCSRRVKILEEAKIIEGYRAILNRAAVHLELTVFVEIQARRYSEETREALLKAILKIPEVVACHMVSGTADLLLEVVVPDMAAYDARVLHYLLLISDVRNIQSKFAIRTYKAAGALPLGAK